jgi:Holliday junction resolvase-like predicted endonuclease
MWLKRHPRCAGLDVRFDLVLVMRNRLPQHRRGVFDHTG